MIKFFKGIKRAADFFNANPDGISFKDEQILKHDETIRTKIETSVSNSAKAILNRHVRDTMQLEHDIYELKETIKILQRKLDKEQVHTPIQSELPIKKGISLDAFNEYWEKTHLRKNLVPSKPKAVKLQAVEEEIKKVKFTLTQAQVKRLFEYRNGELYWKVDVSYRARKGDKAGYVWSYDGYTYKSVSYKSRCYTISRLIFLMFYGYMPEYVTYIDGNSLNTRIENLRAATHSQIMTNRGIRKNNTSGFKGVKYSKNDHKWIAAISKNKKYYHLGSFDTPQEAYKAYCKAAEKLHGEFAQVA